MTIEIMVRPEAGYVNRQRCREHLQAMLQQVHRSQASVSVLFTGDAEMTQLNRTWRRHNRPTDVLSFPLHEPGEARPAACLGDIVIDMDQARRQAACRPEQKQYQRALGAELLLLLRHGLWHLLGYDHETEGLPAWQARDDLLLENLLPSARRRGVR